MIGHWLAFSARMREIIVNKLIANVHHDQPFKVINFDCDEAIASEQQMQDAVAEFDLSLLDM